MKAWLTQIQTMWRGWTTAQKFSIAGAAVLCVIAVIGVGLWSTQSQFVPVAADLSPATAAEIVSALEAAGIETKLNFSGSSVLVPKQFLSRARLASGKLLDINGGADDELDGSIWSDPSLHHTRLLRQQEQRLARSIGQFEFVRTATVHISKPEPSPFIRDRQVPTASVVVELKGTNAIARQDAAAIVALVAHAVEGLNSDQVSVMDTQGHLLSAREPVDGDVAAQLEYRHRLEADLAIKAETLLSQMLGAGRAVVRVTADLDFNERQTEKKTYDPDGKVKVQETIESESGASSPSRTAQSGAPGAGPNVTPGAGSGGGSGSGSKMERSETTYANAETIEKNREVPGRLVRLTVAAVVQLAEKSDAANAASTAPAVDVKQVEQLIRQAVGFDDSRSDQISVVTATLAGAIPELPAAAGIPWDKYEQIARSASLGLAAIVAFLLGFLTLRRLRPTVTVAADGAGGESSADQRLATLSLKARENPEAVAQALNAWLATRNAESPATIPMRKAG